jgi:hypothetical protein
VSLRTGRSVFAILYANGAPFRIKLRTRILLKYLYNFWRGFMDPAARTTALRQQRSFPDVGL